MKPTILKIATILFVSTTLLSACKKGTDPVMPVPVEQELITTLKLHITNSAGFDKSFIYRVENGFNNASPGTVYKDVVALDANNEYDVEVSVLNEKADPVEDITEEVIEESNDHLFIFESSPSANAGSIAVTNGNKDAAGNALNQKVKFQTGAPGTGALTITLKHDPVNKNATNAEEAGGDTDVEAVFEVKLQ